MEPSSRLSRLIGAGILLFLSILIVEVLLEGWLVTLLGERSVDAEGVTVVDPANWPKTLKSGLYMVLLLLTAAKFTVDRSWQSLRTKADLALVVVGVVMVAAGLFGGSSAVLIGQALFVYFRGVIVLYAWRALKPSWREVKPLLWIAGGLLVLNALLGFGQFILGKPGYTSLGWVDLKWVGENRAQGLLDHPNDLGHLSGLMVLGLLAWFVTAEKVKRRWWVLFGLMAVALSIAQSRQSMVAAIAGIAVIAWLHRANYKRLIAAALTVVVLSSLPVVLSPANRQQLAYRLGGLFNSFQMSGDRDSKDDCLKNPACSGQDGEIRVLFAKQGAKLWAERPILGYGVGQFGGIVAVKDDPEWNKDPRFQKVLGPEGFFLHGFKATSVDVFWLHLLVEAGTLGVLAYLIWMYLIGAPLFRAAWRGAREGRLRGSPRTQGILLWSAATLAFAGLIAAWSPSLEDPLFPPLMFSVLGFGWVLLGRQAGSAPQGDDDNVRAERRD